MLTTMPSRRDFLKLSAAAGLGLSLFGRRVWAEDAKLAGDEALGDPRKALPNTLKAIEAGIASGREIGAQLYVSHNNKPIADFGIGEGKRGVAMNHNSMMVWFSSTKPTTGVSVLQQWEKGKFDLDDPVAKHLPEFAAKGKEKVTVRHLLTHTAGIPNALPHANWFKPWDECVAEICAAPLEANWVPGERHGYHGITSWYILGELVKRWDGRPYAQYVREAVFLPLGMKDSWVGMPEETFKKYGERIGDMHVTKDGKAEPTKLITTEQSCLLSIPGGGGRGPIRELGWFYEMLQGRGTRNGVKILNPQTVEAMTTWQRVAMKDTMPKNDAQGLVVFLDAHLYGKHRSPRSYGHSGAESSVAFCDPAHNVVITMVFNGMCGQPKHTERLHDVSTAIYQDLGLGK